MTQVVGGDRNAARVPIHEGKRIEDYPIVKQAAFATASKEILNDFPLTDGQLDIELAHGPAGNPKISAVEIERLK